ncbi:glutamine--fructose-6-phosphate transaminase (isomerizing) [Halodesulfurarchaeum formicicum]|uniref:Glutamine--fructose-6-phosphate aminotransferase [isomerizing] n=1 Tax=Halodesulfurarchaeum formicicum TaxID=1873524 RepID=A0A1J1AAA6_9EURY|nr:glutamine--fructose-6-phosphate transaminase (isomerizing) [Halodesulfurarchaeum formicicum]APE95074.1 glucosamine--fructose-6-phosphate aminotransferase (isomerizing) [Halodesulfurarchaeum formicicum]
MCGITACVGSEDVSDTVLQSLENLEYRGYDSAGLALANGSGIEVSKSEGEVATLKGSARTNRLRGDVGIGHTRWSTHGPPSDDNAHPHTDCSGTVAVVHNGIIENHDQLRAELTERGHEFTSDTDTEVVPHLIEERLDDGERPEAAFRHAVGRLDGSYALAMVVDGEKHVYATRDGSPLVLGVGDGQNYLASDAPAFIEFTDQVVYLEDGDIVVVDRDGYRIADSEGREIDRPVETIDWAAESAEKAGYDHFMLKEIQEQPMALRQTLEGRIKDGKVALKDFPPGTFTDVTNVQFVACGTSYHAAMYGEQLLSQWGIPSTSYLASEYAVYPPPVDDGTLVISVTQSGETADTLEAMRVAQGNGARTLTVTNVVGSSAARESDDALFIRAGPEIGVAATKTFSSQVVALLLLGLRLADDVTGSKPSRQSELLDALADLPQQVQAVLDTSRAEHVGTQYLGDGGSFFIGRGNAYPVALEGALKFKEITYKHAEGFAAGELKHGPLALVTSETPVFAISSGRDADKLRSSISEVQTRGAPVVAVTPRSMTDIVSTADETITVPGTHPDLVPVLANVQLQLVAYHAAAHLERSIDKPRNLAKSVTVE